MLWLTLSCGMIIPGWVSITRYNGITSHPSSSYEVTSYHLSQIAIYVGTPIYHGYHLMSLIAIYFGLPKYHGSINYIVSPSITASTGEPDHHIPQLTQNHLSQYYHGSIKCYPGAIHEDHKQIPTYVKDTPTNRQKCNADIAQAGNMSKTRLRTGKSVMPTSPKQAICRRHAYQ